MAALTLVTGASGFLGSHLLPLLEARGFRLRCLVRDPAFVSAHPVVRGDLGDERAVAAALEGVEQVVHLAALVSFARADAAASFRVNAAGTRRLARLARAAAVRRFLHVSSVAAIGCSDRPQVLDETAPHNLGRLRIPYCDSKRQAELAVLAEVEQGLPAVIVNPASMFGAGERRKARGSLLDKASRGGVPFCPPGGANFADVRDVAAGCVAALAKGRIGERYILGGENLTGRQLLAIVFGVLGKPPPRFTLPAPLVKALALAADVAERISGRAPALPAQLLRLAPRYCWFSSAKAERELGYRAGLVVDAVRATLPL